MFNNSNKVNEYLLEYIDLILPSFLEKHLFLILPLKHLTDNNLINLILIAI